MVEFRDFHRPGRSTVYAVNGMAATSQPLATLAAVDALRAGGNAVDGAIAASAVLCVTEPGSTGIGGDCFMLYAPAGGPDVIALNGSGRAPGELSSEWLRGQGHTVMPRLGVHTVTVPGAVDAWARMSADHGVLGLDQLLQPAIKLARDGYAVTPRIAYDQQRFADVLVDEVARQTFSPGGRLVRTGDIHHQPLLADTLQAIAEGGRDGFYRGPIAAAMVEHLRSHDGHHTEEDFAAHSSEYVVPISTTYHGRQAFQVPPNGQGITALIILNILSGYDLSDFPPGSAAAFHLHAEATREAYAARNDFVSDMAVSEVPIEHLLSPEFAAAARQRIDLTRTRGTAHTFGNPHRDTVYLSVVDRDGNACSHINSIFDTYGSGIMCPRTGVLFQNRGGCFQLAAGHPNELAPNKRPLHTIIPGMLMRDGKVELSYGVMGGHFQSTGHAHVITNILDHGMDVQAALDAPRAFAFDGDLQIENTVPQNVLDALAAKGHRVKVMDTALGGGQAILVDWQRGVLAGGSDPRKDGCALGY